MARLTIKPSVVKYTFLDRVCLLIGLFFCAGLNGQKPVCGNEVFFTDRVSIEKMNEADKIIEDYLLQNAINTRSEIIIPVVVHIVWHKGGENLSDALVLSQIDALNRDFNAENSDIQNVPDEFKPMIGSPRIRFCLAAIDPSGNYTTGIIRVQCDRSMMGVSEDVFFSANGGSDAWDTEKYLNIWVADTGNLISGFGSYPNSVIPEKTGVVIHPKYFGMNRHRKYGMGRTATHEIGHYFGLKHLWADDRDCTTDDEVEDTPPQRNAHTNCPGYPQSGCSESEMFMNFMDYVDDPCMFLFTKGQSNRMLATLYTFRSGLLSGNDKCIMRNSLQLSPLSIYPNPSNGLFHCRFSVAPMRIIKYGLYNAVGQLIRAEEQLINQGFNVDLEHLPTGPYFLKIEKDIYRLIKI
jgi:hypothetical protein